MEKTRPEVRPAAPARGGTRPCLVLVLCGERPMDGTAAFDLAGAREVVLGRGGPLGIRSLGDGRARIDVPDPTMSGDHARLVLGGAVGEPSGGARIEDLGSRNGTRVLGQATAAGVLREGDWFVVGRSAFVLRTATGDVAREPARAGGSARLATFSPALAQTFATAAELAPSRVPLLLLGETGTGKDVLAQEIHALSGRTGRFVAVNCAALPETLVESELFGYRKGAFSDAREDRAGLIRSADRGTLLLDEVGDLPLGSQAKLLRVLQDGQVMALGSAAPVQADLRVLSATQQSLDRLVRDSRFRADLLGRLAGFTVTLPPLRERLEDLGLLVAASLERHAGADAAAFRFTTDALVALLGRRWSLNIRELDRVIEAAIELARDGKEIDARHLAAEAQIETPADLAPAELEAELRRLLRLRQGNVSAVARDLGKARMQIHRWMSQFGIDPAAFRTGAADDDPDAGSGDTGGGP